MTTTAPAADTARPPGTMPSEHALVHASDRTVNPDYPMKPPPSRTRPSKFASQFCDDHDFQLLNFTPFKWKLTLHQYSPPKEKQQDENDNENALLLPSKPIILTLFLDDSFSWLRRDASGCLPTFLIPRLTMPSLQDEDEDDTVPTANSSSCSSPEHSIRKDPPMTTSLLPHVHVTDKRQRHRSSESRLCARMPPTYWNVIYDPTNDQIQVYENNRVRVYKRQRKSRRFVYRYGKHENTFPRNAKIAIGHWQNSYFVLLSTTPRPLVTYRQVKPDSFLIPPELIKPLPVLLQPPPNRMLFHRPSPTCRHKNHIRNANSKARARPRPARDRSQIEINPTSSHCKRVPSLDTRQSTTRKKRELTEFLRTWILTRYHAPQPILRLTRQYLDAYFFSIAEVLLEQNVDPG